MRALCLAALVTLALGCASLSPSQRGLNLLNSGKNAEAYYTFLACGRQGDPYCINNLGYMFENSLTHAGKDMDLAISHYWLAARYGIPVAQANLSRLGHQPPPVDLYQAPAGHAEPLSPEAAQAIGTLAELVGRSLAR